jgi:hypothetical protein
MYSTIMFLAHIWLIYPLGHAYAESELEIQVEQVQKECCGPQVLSAKILIFLLDHDKPRCIKTILLIFYFKSCVMFYYDCAINL